MFGLCLVLSEIEFGAKGMALDVLHRGVEKAMYPGIEIAPLPRS